MDLRDIKEFFRDCLDYAIWLGGIALIFTFVIAFHPVAGNSMTSTLEEGDITLVSKFYHKVFDIERNNIVIVKKGSKTYIKRIIGLPGENIAYEKNHLYINGNRTKEVFLDKETFTANFDFEDICDLSECKDGVIPKDYYLVMGDNRNNSLDSRDKEFGLVSKDEIKGIALVKIWPLNKIKALN